SRVAVHLIPIVVQRRGEVRRQLERRAGGGGLVVETLAEGLRRQRFATGEQDDGHCSKRRHPRRAYEKSIHHEYTFNAGSARHPASRSAARTASWNRGESGVSGSRISLWIKPISESVHCTGIGFSSTNRRALRFDRRAFSMRAVTTSLSSAAAHISATARG